MTKPILLKREEGEIWNVFGEKIICRVSGAETFGRFSIVEENSAPQSVVPPHLHRQTDEIIYVLEGEYEIETNGKKTIARKGDTLFIPRGTTHGFRNLLMTESRLLAVITPSGFENFFAEISGLPAEFGAQEIVEIGRRNDLEIVL